jgi:hypothetical protein
VCHGQEFTWEQSDSLRGGLLRHSLSPCLGNRAASVAFARAASALGDSALAHTSAVMRHYEPTKDAIFCWRFAYSPCWKSWCRGSYLCAENVVLHSVGAHHDATLRRKIHVRWVKITASNSAQEADWKRRFVSHYIHEGSTMCAEPLPIV